MATPNDRFLTVRLPADEYQRVRDAADSDDRKLGPMARVLIKAALDAREVRAEARARAGRKIADAPQA